MSKRKSYTDEFKKQIVALYNNGKPTRELVREYCISAAAVYKWAKEYETTGSFRAADNRTPEENELLELRKEVKQLRMENDILKQAALIMGRK
jgi:transposase